MTSAPHTAPWVVVVQQAREHLTAIIACLAPLGDPSAPPLQRVDAYFDPFDDELLLGLTFDPSVADEIPQDWLSALVASVGEVIDADGLDDIARRVLREIRMESCEIRVENAPTVALALGAVQRRLMVPRGTGAPPLSQRIRAAARTATGNTRPLPRPAAVTLHPPFTRPPIIIETRRVTPSSPPPPVMVSTASEAVARLGSPVLTGPPPAFDVRFLWSGRWAPARLRAISEKGAYMVASALPRNGDRVHLALALGEQSALLRGQVFHVTSPADAAARGATGFGIHFATDASNLAQLEPLLRQARVAHLTLPPPSARASARVPVTWPVSLATPRGTIGAEALDVSSGGMYLHPLRALELDRIMSFSATLDDSGGPLTGHVRVVRHLDEDEARRRGLRAGYGVRIDEVAEPARWRGFLSRVQWRSERRLIVGAAATRLAELSFGLMAAGYSVTGVTDTASILQVIDGEPRAPDAAVLDSSALGDAESARIITSMFRARAVPCVTMSKGGTVVRDEVDRLLGLAVAPVRA